MKIRLIKVPSYKCALDVLARMGRKTRNAWIFFHQNVIDKLSITAEQRNVSSIYQEFEWKETKDGSKTILDFEKKPAVWKRVYRICAKNIAFRIEPPEPKIIIFIKMQD